MEKTRQRRISTERHVQGMAHRTVRGAGTPTKVGQRIGRSTSAACHEGKTEGRMHPALKAAYTFAMTLAGPETTIRPFANAVRSLLELREIVNADTATLRDRALYLLDREDDLNAATDKASRRDRAAFTEALRAQSLASDELADILDELDFRGEPLAMGGWA